MHFCHVELIAIMTAIPMLGVAVAWVRSLLKANKTAETAETSCTCHEHNVSQQDLEALRSDWETVGNDLRRAMGVAALPVDREADKLANQYFHDSPKGSRKLN